MSDLYRAFVTRINTRGEEIETQDIVQATFVKPIVSMTGAPVLMFATHRGDMVHPDDVILRGDGEVGAEELDGAIAAHQRDGAALGIGGAK